MAWRVYVRFGRSVGRQPLEPRRLITRIVVFGVISVMIAVGLLSSPGMLPYFGGGLLLGVPFALLGLRHTRFETTGAVHSFTPNTHIGLALTLLLAGRFAYRVMVLILNSSPGADAPPMVSFLQSPLTLGLFGLTAGYYITYYAGVLRHARDKV